VLLCREEAEGEVGSETKSRSGEQNGRGTIAAEEEGEKGSAQQAPERSDDDAHKKYKSGRKFCRCKFHEGKVTR